MALALSGADAARWDGKRHHRRPGQYSASDGDASSQSLTSAGEAPAQSSTSPVQVSAAGPSSTPVVDSPSDSTSDSDSTPNSDSSSGSGSGSDSSMPVVQPSISGTVASDVPAQSANAEVDAAPQSVKPTGGASAQASTSTAATSAQSGSANAQAAAACSTIKAGQPAQSVTPNVDSYVTGGGLTMNGLDNPVCSEVTLIFARGTTEQGNMGTGVGQQLAKALRAQYPSLSVQGVDYPANSEGDTHFGASGGPMMAQLAHEARCKCPDTKIVLTGYSQGARCIHGALGHVDDPVDGNDVAAIVAYGDPLNGDDPMTGVSDRKKIYEVCGKEDTRCQSGQVDLATEGGHTDYGPSADAVAKWIKSTVG